MCHNRLWTDLDLICMNKHLKMARTKGTPKKVKHRLVYRWITQARHVANDVDGKGGQVAKNVRKVKAPPMEGRRRSKRHESS